MLASTPVVFGQAMGGGLSTNLIFFGALFAIMYFVLIRPQQKQAKEQQNMLAQLKKGDDVITQGGILGKIFSVADKVVTLEVSSGVKLRVLKSSIQGKVTISDEAPKSETADAKKEEK